MWKCASHESACPIPTLRIMSPSCRLPSLVARPVLVISFMKIWLPSRRPYSRRQTRQHARISSTGSENLAWYLGLFKNIYKKINFTYGTFCKTTGLESSNKKSHHKENKKQRDYSRLRAIKTECNPWTFTRSLIQCGEEVRGGRGLIILEQLQNELYHNILKRIIMLTW